MKKGQFEYILFDWDGCLADTLSIWMDAYLSVFAGYGFSPTRKDIAEKVFGIHSGHRIIGVTDDEGFRLKLNTEVNPKLKKASLHPYVYETLNEVKSSGRKLAVISSSYREIVVAAITHNKLSGMFDSIVCREDVNAYKPDPEGILKTMGCLHAKSEKSIMIGDADKDVEAGRNAGITSCIYYPKVNENIYSRQFLENLKPDYLIEDFRKLLEIL